MQQQAWQHEPSLGDLFGELTRETRQLVQQEVKLAKIELKESATRMGKGAGLLGASAVFGIGASLALMTALIALLSTFMPVWLAALIVAIAEGGVGFMLYRRGLAAFTNAQLTPTQTIETVREDVLWLKNRN
jgi:hypothetical protein